MQRAALGLTALALLAGAGVLAWWDSDRQALTGALVRAGTVLAAIWLAYDALRRIPWISLIGLPVLILLLLFSRTAKWLLLLVPIVIVLALLWPRGQANR